MRIIHTNTIAGVPWALAKAQEKLGHNAFVLAFRADRFGFPFDASMELDKHSKLLNPFIRLKWFLWSFGKFDVYHFHSSSFLPFYLDCPILRLLGKVVVYHHWGSDIRGKGIPFWSRFCSIRYVGTPDLLEFAPDAKFLGYPIDLEYWKPKSQPKRGKLRKKQVLRVVHAPSVRAVKGTDAVERACKLLVDSGLPIELEVVNVPYSGVKGKLESADLVIDQLKIGFYGTLSAQAMALGKPVICFVRKELMPEGCPIVNANVDTLEQVLKLVCSPDVLKRLGERGRLFVTKKHDAVKIAKETIKDYEEARKK